MGSLGTDGRLKFLSADAFGTYLGDSITGQTNTAQNALDKSAGLAQDDAQNTPSPNANPPLTTNPIRATDLNANVSGPDLNSLLLPTWDLYTLAQTGDPNPSGNLNSDAAQQSLVAPGTGAATTAANSDPTSLGGPLVTNQVVLGRDGTQGLLTSPAGQAVINAEIDQVGNLPTKTIFDPRNPHQYLLVVADDGTRNSPAQDLPTNPYTLTNLVSHVDNVSTIYIDGVASEHDFLSLNAMLGLGAPVQVNQTLSKISDTVNQIYSQDANATFVFATIGFSRGADDIRIVQNALVNQGVVNTSLPTTSYDSDGNATTTYNSYIIPPHTVNIGASLLYDTVSTGLGSFFDPSIPTSNVQQTLSLTAGNEYRTFFPLTSALSSPDSSTTSGDGWITEITVPGAHTNIGGGTYDQNGIGAATLLMGYTFLQDAGVPLQPLPANDLPDPSKYVIYDSRWLHTGSFYNLVTNPNSQRTTYYAPSH